MKKFLSIAGGFFLVVILAFGGIFGYMAWQGRGLDASSRAYVKANLPAILSTWSEDELVKRSSPQMVKILDKNPEQTNELFKKFSMLGTMQSLGKVKGDSNVFYSTHHGKVTTASYDCEAKFQKGEAHVAVGLIFLSGRWRIQRFNVSSPIFLQ